MPEGDQYIYVLHAARPEMFTTGLTAEEIEIQSLHSAYVSRLSEERVVLLYGRTMTTDADTFGIVIFKAETEAAAQSVMENDPGVKYGLQRAKLYPYKVAFMAGS